MLRPSIGRIVHYVHRLNPSDHHAEVVHSAAIVTAVPENDGRANIAVYIDGDDTATAIAHVPYSSIPKVGTWHWPEFVDAHLPEEAK